MSDVDLAANIRRSLECLTRHLSGFEAYAAEMAARRGKSELADIAADRADERLATAIASRDQLSARLRELGGPHDAAISSIS